MLRFPVPLLEHHKVEQTTERPTRGLVILRAWSQHGPITGRLADMRVSFVFQQLTFSGCWHGPAQEQCTVPWSSGDRLAHPVAPCTMAALGGPSSWSPPLASLSLSREGPSMHLLLPADKSAQQIGQQCRKGRNSERGQSGNHSHSPSPIAEEDSGPNLNKGGFLETLFSSD